MIQKGPLEGTAGSSWEKIVASKRADRDAAVQPWLTNDPASGTDDANSEDLTITPQIEQLVSRMATGAVTAEEVTVAHIKRIAGAQRQTNCLTEVLFSEAVEQARTLDAHFKFTGQLLGPFHGVPVTLKDQFNVKGHDSTLGYVGRAYKPAKDDAYIVEILKKLGAVVLAKTNLPQSIMWCETDNPLFGLTTNPRNPDFTPGGSTGGEACVLHYGGSLLGWGTDIGGSIRIPAHMNGLYGLKPTSSRMSYVGVPVSTEGQQHVPSAIGPMTRSLSSMIAVTRAVVDAKAWEIDPAVTPKPWDEPMFEDAQSRPLTIGVMFDDGVVKVHPPIERALFEMTKLLQAAGHEVVWWDSSLHADCIRVMDQYYNADGGEDIRRDIAAGGEPMIPHVEALVNRAPCIPVYEYWQLNKEKIALQKAYYDKWNSKIAPSGRKVDVLLTPTMPHTALPHKGCRWVGYTKVWNFLDYPAVVFPAGKADKSIDSEMDSNHVPRNDADAWNWSRYDPETMDGHPVGLQVIARRFEEERVLGVAKICENLLTKSKEQAEGANGAAKIDWASLFGA